MNTEELPGSAGEHEMQKKFGTKEKAKDFYDKQMLDYLSPHMQSFIQTQEMVFVATSDKNGECDNSIRTGEAGFVVVIDEKTIVYADFKGNGVLASAGNISENPHIGMLFVDFFEDKVGLHVNGKASLFSDSQFLSFLGKKNLLNKKPILNQKISFWVVIDIEEAYIHCSRNIPLLKKNDDIKAITKSRVVDYFKLGS